MKVSTKIITGFFVLTLVVMVVIVNHLSAIRQIQDSNRELSEINVASAKTALQIVKVADLLDEYSKKYFAGLDTGYDEQISDVRMEFLENLTRLHKTAKSDLEQAQEVKLEEALDDFWSAFSRLKKQKRTVDPDDMPADYTVAVNRLRMQASTMLDTVQIVINNRVQAAADIGNKAERVTWIAGTVA